MKRDSGTYPTTMQYEFYDENGDLLPDQFSYAPLLGSIIDKSMRLPHPYGYTIGELKRQRPFWEKQFPYLFNLIKEKSNGTYTLLEFAVDHEVKGSYIILYFQYKIKQMI